jgi:hypothetical protein
MSSLSFSSEGFERGLIFVLPMLLEQEGEKHKESAVMNDPPNVDVSLRKQEF